MHSKWKSLEKIVLCDSNLVIIDTKKKINISQSFIIFNNESCFQTHLQHNYPDKNVERQYVTSPEMRMTSVISLHSNVTSITSQHVQRVKERGFTLFTFIRTLVNDYLGGFQVFSRAIIAHFTHISSFHVSLR